MILRWRKIYHRLYKPCDQARRKFFCVGYLYVMSGLWSALSKTDTNKTSTPITNNMSTWGLLAISLLQYYQTKIKKNLVKYDRRKSILVLSVIWPIPLSSPMDNNTAFNNRKKTNTGHSRQPFYMSKHQGIMSASYSPLQCYSIERSIRYYILVLTEKSIDTWPRQISQQLSAHYKYTEFTTGT